MSTYCKLLFHEERNLSFSHSKPVNWSERTDLKNMSELLADLSVTWNTDNIRPTKLLQARFNFRKGFKKTYSGLQLKYIFAAIADRFCWSKFYSLATVMFTLYCSLFTLATVLLKYAYNSLSQFSMEFYTFPFFLNKHVFQQYFLSLMAISIYHSPESWENRVWFFSRYHCVLW